MMPARVPHVPATPAPGQDGAASAKVTEISCSRIGLRANPPRRTLVDWLLPSRRG